ncbi:hypothetical protein WJU16_24305 [Chitinophaga pollutisoli]|uniref:Uncharacterized protein n=1 Tax=Chitinophaga pollutisoli TaxID=3133966 RepID=A0ABZ2YQG3_9BACT
MGEYYKGKWVHYLQFFHNDGMNTNLKNGTAKSTSEKVLHAFSPYIRQKLFAMDIHLSYKRAYMKELLRLTYSLEHAKTLRTPKTEQR